jgi:hypothetical protein
MRNDFCSVTAAADVDIDAVSTSADVHDPGVQSTARAANDGDASTSASVVAATASTSLLHSGTDDELQLVVAEPANYITDDDLPNVLIVTGKELTISARGPT